MAVVKLVATLSSYGRRAVVVGGVADRYPSELARAGQSNRRRAGTGSASPERATRAPLWPAGMAQGNRETFGPRVGLSSHGSPAKGGPKSKCLARLKIARTSWATQFNNIGPVPLSASCPAFRFDAPRLRPGRDRARCGHTGRRDRREPQTDPTFGLLHLPRLAGALRRVRPAAARPRSVEGSAGEGGGRAHRGDRLTPGKD